MNQYLYRLELTRPTLLLDGPTREEASALDAHAAYVERLTRASTVLLAGRTQRPDDDAFGIVILQAESDEAAQRVMQEDPAVEQGVMRAELFPYRIAFLAERIGELAAP